MEELLNLYEIDIGGKYPYDFLNENNLPVEIGNNVFVKVGTGGAKLGKVVKTKKGIKDKKYDYKSIVEIVGLSIEPPVLSEDILNDNFQIALGRVYRNQWDTDSKARIDDWSDCVFKFDMPNIPIKTGDVFLSQGQKVRIVGFSTLPNKSRAKRGILETKVEKKKSFFTKLFGL